MNKAKAMAARVKGGKGPVKKRKTGKRIMRT